MAGRKSEIDVRLRLRDAAKFQKDARASGKSLESVGGGARKGERGLLGFHKRLTSTSTLAGRSVGGFKRLAGAAVGLGAGYLAIGGAKSAIDTTEGLAKATIGLSKNLGLSVEEASAWASVAKTRGVETKALNMSFGTLSKNIDAANQGGKSQIGVFQRLGITQGQLKKLGFEGVLGRVSDGIRKMGPGANRTALSMKLFGRGWQTIVPVLRDGSKGMNEQLALAKKYGATFGGKTIKTMQEFIQAQRESQFAMLGLQITFATLLVPILTRAIRGFSQFVLGIRRGTGAGGQFRDIVVKLWNAMRPTLLVLGGIVVMLGKFAAKHPGLLKVAGAILAVSLAVKALRFAGAITGVSHLLGLLRRLGRTRAGERAATEILDSFGPRFQAPLGGRFGRIRGKLRGFGASSGRAFGIAFRVAVFAALALFAFELGKWIGDHIRKPLEKLTGGKNLGERAKDLQLQLMDQAAHPPPGTIVPPWPRAHRKPKGFARGGILRSIGLVGEAGPEVAIHRSGGTEIRPLGNTPALAGFPAGAFDFNFYLDSKPLHASVVRRERDMKARR